MDGYPLPDDGKPKNKKREVDTMNKQRRKELDEIHTLLLEAAERLEAVAEEEQEAFDNLPEGLQQSERGQEMEETAANLQEWADSLSDLVGDLWEVLEQ